VNTCVFTSALLQLLQNTRPAYDQTQCYDPCIYICGVGMCCWQVSEEGSPASLLRYKKLEGSKRRQQREEQPIQLISNLQKAFTQSHSMTCRLLGKASGPPPPAFASMSLPTAFAAVPVHLTLPIKCTRTAIKKFDEISCTAVWKLTWRAFKILSHMMPTCCPLE